MFPDVKLELPNDLQEVKLTENQQKIKNIWSELLGTNDFGIYDNFFDLGGKNYMKF